MSIPSEFTILKYNLWVNITHLVFDLDDTLYPPGNGLWTDIGERINLYLIERMGVRPEDANSLRRQYYQKYGATLRGLLMERPGFNPDEYLDFVHAVDVNRYLTPAPELAALLSEFPQQKVIFTNADQPHANRVLSRLGLKGIFEPVIDIRLMNFNNKPLPEAYAALFRHVAASPEQCLYLEDSARNLEPAKSLGMKTLLVSAQNEPNPAVDWQAPSIMEAGDLIRAIVNP
jgi:putative hydrolase of the HAD superfamily